MEIYLETERMLLRELCLADEGNLFELDSDPKVMEFLTDGAPSTCDEVRGSLERIEALHGKHAGCFGYWAAIAKNSGRFMGWFHFLPSKKDPENTDRIELGFRLRREFWGNGYATEGSRTLIEKGFCALRVGEVFATTMKRNLASQKVMNKAGLAFLREFRLEEYRGPDKEAVEHSLRREEWSRNRGQIGARS